MNMSEEVLSSITQTFKQLIVDAYMTFRNAGSQTWCSSMEKAPLPSQGVHAKNW